MSDNLVHWYTRYRIERAKIKARQRVELDKELEPLAHELGRAIIAERAKGLRIQDIGFIIGLKNRSFIYTMIDNFNDKDSPKLPVPEPESFVVTPEEPTEPEYIITYNGNSAQVRIGTVDYIILLSNGEVVATPDEWLHAPREDRKKFARIIKEIEDGAKAA